jgi:hypothetical protein
MKTYAFLLLMRVVYSDSQLLDDQQILASSSFINHMNYTPLPPALELNPHFANPLNQSSQPPLLTPDQLNFMSPPPVQKVMPQFDARLNLPSLPLQLDLSPHFSDQLDGVNLLLEYYLVDKVRNSNLK